MAKNENAKKENKVKKFFSNLAERIDKNLQQKAKSSQCCGGNKGGGNSCCS